MTKELYRNRAIETVDTLIADLENAVRRGVAVFGTTALVTSVIPSFIDRKERDASVAPENRLYTGERRDLQAVLGCDHWIAAFQRLAHLSTETSGVMPGDYIRVPLKARAGHYDGLAFEALDIEAAEAVVVHVACNKIIFNFEEVLFHSAINRQDTNRGGFKDSALSRYLNSEFLDALGPIQELLAKNKEGNRITLPTSYEVFGNDDGNDVNWDDEPRQLDYFKQIKNRIRTKDNDTTGWWLSTPAAATSTNFCNAHSGGSAGDHYASNVGGCAPAFCVA